MSTPRRSPRPRSRRVGSGSKESQREPSGEGRREGGADDEQDPAPLTPRLAEPGDLDEDVGEVRGAVADIREHGQDKEQQNPFDRYDVSTVGPAAGEIAEDDQRQDGVVDESAGLPVPDGVGHRIADTRRRVQSAFDLTRAR